MLKGDVKDILLLDVTPLSLGEDNIFSEKIAPVMLVFLFMFRIGDFGRSFHKTHQQKYHHPHQEGPGTYLPTIFIFLLTNLFCVNESNAGVFHRCRQPDSSAGVVLSLFDVLERF